MPRKPGLRWPRCLSCGSRPSSPRRSAVRPVREAAVHRRVAAPEEALEVRRPAAHHLPRAPAEQAWAAAGWVRAPAAAPASVHATAILDTRAIPGTVAVSAVAALLRATPRSLARTIPATPAASL